MTYTNSILRLTACGLVAASAWAQSPISLQVTTASLAAGPAAGNSASHARALAGAHVIRDFPRSLAPAPAVPKGGFYPSDVVNPANRPGVVSAQNHAIYVNNPPSHWGNPETFLKDLFNSDLIHVIDQYVGSTANNRYTVGKSFQVTYANMPHTLQDDQIYQLIHSAEAVSGGGYGHVYHVFLPQGTDVCHLASNDCFSPDVPSTFAICAYHGVTYFADNPSLPVLYTVQPYGDVAGCQVQPGTPNGTLADSINNSLSHETFETLSDPDFTAWFVRNTVDIFEEMADECIVYITVPTTVFTMPTVYLNGHPYSIQAEYSNQYHGCVYSSGFGFF